MNFKCTAGFEKQVGKDEGEIKPNNVPPDHNAVLKKAVRHHKYNEGKKEKQKNQQEENSDKDNESRLKHIVRMYTK